MYDTRCIIKSSLYFFLYHSLIFFFVENDAYLYDQFIFLLHFLLVPLSLLLLLTFGNSYNISDRFSVFSADHLNGVGWLFFRVSVTLMTCFLQQQTFCLLVCAMLNYVFLNYVINSCNQNCVALSLILFQLICSDFLTN